MPLLPLGFSGSDLMGDLADKYLKVFQKFTKADTSTLHSMVARGL